MGVHPIVNSILVVAFCSIIAFLVSVPAFLAISDIIKVRQKKKARAIVGEHLKMLCDDGNLIEYEEAMLKLAEIGITDKIDIITYNSMRSDMRYEFRARGYGDGKR